MSKTFFNALGRQFLRKHAARIPWPAIVRKLRKEELLPNLVPHLPYLEPNEEPPAPPPEESPPMSTVPPPEVLPVPVVLPVEEAAPEPPPKRQPEGSQT